MASVARTLQSTNDIMLREGLEFFYGEGECAFDEAEDADSVGFCVEVGDRAVVTIVAVCGYEAILPHLY